MNFGLLAIYIFCITELILGITHHGKLKHRLNYHIIESVLVVFCFLILTWWTLEWRIW